MGEMERNEESTLRVLRFQHRRWTYFIRPGSTMVNTKYELCVCVCVCVFISLYDWDCLCVH